MDWIYENPHRTKAELEVQTFIERKTRNKQIAEKATRMLSLRRFLYTHSFRNAADLQNSVFYDKEKTRPIFNKETAKKIYSTLKKRGGGDHDVTDKAVRAGLTYLQSYLPESLQNFTTNVYNYATVLKWLKKSPAVGPFLDVGLSALHSGTNTAIVTTDTAAAEIGGPLGTAVVSIPVLLTAATAAAAHVSEDNLGDAVHTLLLGVPFVGIPSQKALAEAEKMITKASEHKTQLASLPLIGSLATYLPDKTGGKRFSTRRHKIYNKWKRTMRARFAMH
jgi:hypothetical protein